MSDNDFEDADVTQWKPTTHLRYFAEGPTQMAQLQQLWRLDYDSSDHLVEWRNVPYVIGGIE